MQAGKRSSKESKKEKHNKASNLKNQSDYYCYDDIDHPYVFFATKTSYRWNRNKNDDEITPPGKFCHLFLVICNNAIDGTEKNLLPNFLP